MGEQTKAIMRCVRDALNAKTLEECHALAEAAENGIEALESENARMRNALERIIAISSPPHQQGHGSAG